MSYTKVHYTDVDSKSGLYFLRDSLDCEQLGVSVIDVEDGRDGFEHDHGDVGQEEVYVLTSGSATMTIEDEELSMHPGDAIRVSPGDTRQVDLHGDSQMVIVGAP